MAACDFVLVDTRQMLRDVFPLLDEGVEAIEARLPKRECVAADLYAAALNGDVSLRLVRVEEQTVGFMALQSATDLAGTRSLHVWMLYLRPGTPDVLGDVTDELEYLAAEMGCKEINFVTVRAAWERRLAPHGFVPRSITFTKEVSCG